MELKTGEKPRILSWSCYARQLERENERLKEELEDYRIPGKWAEVLPMQIRPEFPIHWEDPTE